MPPKHKASSAVEAGGRVAPRDCPVALLAIVPIGAQPASDAPVEDAPGQLLSESAAGPLCALKTNPVHICLKFLLFCGCLKKIFFQLLNVLFGCR